MSIQEQHRLSSSSCLLDLEAESVLVQAWNVTSLLFVWSPTAFMRCTADAVRVLLREFQVFVG